jgi:hypothetical protein
LKLKAAISFRGTWNQVQADAAEFLKEYRGGKNALALAPTRLTISLANYPSAAKRRTTLTRQMELWPEERDDVVDATMDMIAGTTSPQPGKEAKKP